MATQSSERIAADEAKLRRSLAKARREQESQIDGRPRVEAEAWKKNQDFDPLLHALIREHGPKDEAGQVNTLSDK